MNRATTDQVSVVHGRYHTIIAHIRANNLSGILVRATCGTQYKRKEGKHIMAGTSKILWLCKMCPKPTQSRLFRSTSTGREYTGPEKYICKTENVVYLITCKNVENNM